MAITELLKYNPAVLRILDIDETREAELKNKLGQNSSIRFLLGDVRDKERFKTSG